MRKNAFTLMELLVTLAIIGLTATLVAPIISNLMPDKAKMQVIKAHKALAEATAEILDDPSFYRAGVYETVEGSDIECPGLTDFNNWDNSLVSPNEKKYYDILSEYKFETVEKPTTIINGNNDFLTADGVRWSVSASERKSNVTTQSYEITYTVTIDLNNTEGPNSFASASVRKPDRFSFEVDTYGKVTGADALTKQYLKTRTDFHNKKEDYKAAFGS